MPQVGGPKASLKRIVVTRGRFISPKPIIIWGASGHALVASDIFRLLGEFMIAGYLDDVDKSRKGHPFGDAVVLGGWDDLQLSGISSVFVAVGNNRARLAIAERVVNSGISLVSAIHPSAVVARSVAIGPGTLVAAGAVVNPAARIGANVIINTGACIDHECVIEDGAHIGPGASLGGRVRVGRGSWVAIGATVSDRIEIGAGAVVGAGAVALDDVPPGVVAYGVPARPVREVGEDEKQ